MATRTDHGNSAGFSRRGALSLLAAPVTMGGIAGVRVMVANASPYDPDAYLIELGRLYLEAYARREAFVDEVLEPTEIRLYETRTCEIPKACYWQGADLPVLGLPYPQSVDGDKRRYYGADEIDTLRTEPRMMQDHSSSAQVAVSGNAGYQIGRKPNPKAQARADEIVQAYDNWKAEEERVERETGFTEANSLYSQMSAVIEDMERKILATRAITIKGLIVKAQCADPSNGGPALSLDKEIEREIEKSDGIVTAGVLSLSIARDLVNIAKHGGALGSVLG